MASSKIKVSICEKCGKESTEVPYWEHRRNCGGVFKRVNREKKVAKGEFVFDSSFGIVVTLRNVETGEKYNIFTEDLLKLLAGRSLGVINLVEGKRGTSFCWKPEEVKVNGSV